MTVQPQTAQATLSGEVRNPQGVALVGVRIFVENQQTMVVTSAVTNSQGQYVIQFIPQGQYTARVQAVGYRPLDALALTSTWRSRQLLISNSRRCPPTSRAV